MDTTVATVVGIEPRKVTTKYGEKTVWDFMLDNDMKVSTFDTELAQQMMPGVSYQLFYESLTRTTERGTFTNHTLKSAKRLEGVTVPQTLPTGLNPQEQLPLPPVPSGGPTGASGREEAIMRQTAGKCAAELLSGRNSGLAMVRDVAEMFYGWFSTGQWPPYVGDTGDDIPF